MQRVTRQAQPLVPVLLTIVTMAVVPLANAEIPYNASEAQEAGGQRPPSNRPILDHIGSWTVERHTGALEVVAVDPTPGWEVIKLKNRSSKKITAYITSASSFMNTMDYIQSGHGVAPGAEELWRIGPQLARSTDNTIRILGVIFEDGSSDGDASGIREVHFTRLGMLLEYARIEPIFSARAGDLLEQSDKDALMAAVGPLPQTAEEALKSLSGVNLHGLSTRSVGATSPDPTQSRQLMLRFLGGVRAIREDAQIKLKTFEDPTRFYASGEPEHQRRVTAFKILAGQYKDALAALEDYASRTKGVNR